MRKSIIKKHGSSLGFFTNIFNVLNFLLSSFGVIPQEIRSNNIFKILAAALLVIGCIIFIRFLSTLLNQKSFGSRVLWHGLTISFFALMITSAIMQQKPKATIQPILVNSKNTVNTQTQNSNLNKTTVQSDSAKSIHVINGNRNIVGVNGNVTYEINKPVSRKLNRKDVKFILASIPSKDFSIKINYPSNNIEAKNFSKQIIDTLFRLGYSNISEATVSNSYEYFDGERISVKKYNSPTPSISLIISPQQ